MLLEHNSFQENSIRFGIQNHIRSLLLVIEDQPLIGKTEISLKCMLYLLQACAIKFQLQHKLPKDFQLFQKREVTKIGDFLILMLVKIPIQSPV